MLLAEELLLLLVKKRAMLSPLHTGMHAALAAAVLVELAETERVTIAGDRVTGHHGDRHPLAADFAGASIERSVTHIGLGLYPVLLDRLTDQGVLVRGTRFWQPVWQLADERRRAALVAELEAVLVGDVPPTTRTGSLLGLLHALRLTEFLFPGMPSADLSRAARLADESWPVRVFTATVAACKRSNADLPGVMRLDNRRGWALRPSEPPAPSR